MLREEGKLPKLAMQSEAVLTTTLSMTKASEIVTQEPVAKIVVVACPEATDPHGPRINHHFATLQEKEKEGGVLLKLYREWGTLVSVRESASESAKWDAINSLETQWGSCQSTEGRAELAAQTEDVVLTTTWWTLYRQKILENLARETRLIYVGGGPRSRLPVVAYCLTEGLVPNVAARNMQGIIDAAVSSLCTTV